MNTQMLDSRLQDFFLRNQQIRIYKTSEKHNMQGALVLYWTNIFNEETWVIEKMRETVSSRPLFTRPKPPTVVIGLL
jgi:hypothetical protein